MTSFPITGGLRRRLPPIFFAAPRPTPVKVSGHRGRNMSLRQTEKRESIDGGLSELVYLQLKGKLETNTLAA